VWGGVWVGAWVAWNQHKRIRSKTTFASKQDEGHSRHNHEPARTIHEQRNTEEFDVKLKHTSRLTEQREFWNHEKKFSIVCLWVGVVVGWCGVCGGGERRRGGETKTSHLL